MKLIPLLAALIASAAPLAAQGAFLGVELAPTNGPGAEVQKVREDTPAEIAGLKAGDVIMSVNDEKVADTDSLIQIIRQKQPGDIVSLGLRRNGEVVMQKVVLGRRPGPSGLSGPGGPSTLQRLRLAPGEKFEVTSPEKALALLEEQNALERGLAKGRIIQVEPGHTFRLSPGGGAGRQEFRVETHAISGDAEPGEFLDGLEFEHTGDGSGVQLTFPAGLSRSAQNTLTRRAKERFGPKTTVQFEGEGCQARFHSSTGGNALKWDGGFGGTGETGETGARRLRVEDLEGFDWESGGPVRIELDEEGLEGRILLELGSDDDTKLRVRKVKPAKIRGDVRESENGGTGAGGNGVGSLERAMSSARSSGKPVLIDFYADWCGPCRRLGEEVLANPQHQELLQRFELVKINTDDNQKLASEFGVGGIPDLRILAADGSEIARVKGYSGVEATVKSLKEALHEAGSRGSSRGGARESHAELELQERLQKLEREIESLESQLQKLRGSGGR